MNAVITLGIDMASQPKGTAACAVIWEADRAVAVTPCLGCDDGILSEMIAKSQAVGIDAPFGWPAEFAVAVGAWSFSSWTTQLRERLCFRKTDRFVHEKLGRWPLSGSDRAARGAYIRAVVPLWSYRSQRRQKVLRSLSCSQADSVGADEQRLQEEHARSQTSAREHLGRPTRDDAVVGRAGCLRHDREWPRRADRIADCPRSDAGSHTARHT
jgi:Protein of unknown function (DUF429)